MPSHDSQNKVVPKLSVIIPAYNEEFRIGPVIKSTHVYLASRTDSFEIIVVLNNCTDGTKSVIETLMQSMSELSLIDMGIIENHSGNTKGLAVREGMLKSNGDLRLFVDADQSTAISELEKLLPFVVDGYEVVFGSRRVPGSHIPHDQPWYRVVLGRAGNFLIRLFVLPGVRDTQCGFKLFSKEAALKIFSELRTTGWGFDIETLVLAKKFGFRFREVGITWTESPNTRVKPSAYWETLKELFSIWLRKFS